jgi:N-ethylmaleimide reductase
MGGLPSPLSCWLRCRLLRANQTGYISGSRNRQSRVQHEFSFIVSQLEVGPYRLDHRVVMAPLTRMRAEKPSLAPRPLNVEYYAQRANPGGLIIAEASPVVATGLGSPKLQRMR